MKSQIFDRIHKPEVLVDGVVEQISNAVMGGILHPGDKLVEERLAVQMGISRVPVREAITHLEQMGLVEKIPYRGTFVSQLTEKDVIELHNVRVALETLAAQLLAQKHSPQATEELRSLIDEMKLAAINKDRQKMVELDAAFHDALIGLTDNKLLIDVWALVSLKMRRFMLLKRHHTYKTIEAVVLPHERIAQKIETGDVEGSVQAVHEHLAVVEESFIQVIRNKQPLT
jgi:DNA-binding GntR family transcriptional regulator